MSLPKHLNVLYTTSVIHVKKKSWLFEIQYHYARLHSSIYNNNNNDDDDDDDDGGGGGGDGDDDDDGNILCSLILK